MVEILKKFQQYIWRYGILYIKDKFEYLIIKNIFVYFYKNDLITFKMERTVYCNTATIKKPMLFIFIVMFK